MNITKSMVLGHIFKDNEGMYIFISVQPSQYVT